MEGTGSIDVEALTSVRDKIVVVTGAGQGIGRTFAKVFAAAGAVPVIAEINGEKAEAVSAEIREAGGRAAVAVADMSNADAVEGMVSRLVSEFGRIDVLINNAGIFSTLKMRPFDEIPLEEWRKVLEVNITGVMLCCRAVVPHMRAAGWGRIVNMSSGSILLGRANYLHYTTSKSALVGMTRSMAREVGASGITVNAVMPGAVVTEIPRETVTPEQREAINARQCIPRAQTPDDLVGLMLFLASEGSRFMTGQTINIDGGAAHL